MRKSNLFVVGDSISMHYGPYLKEYAAAGYNYARKGEGEAAINLDVASDANGGDSAACLAYLKTLLAAPNRPIDVLLWNCGLHDVKTTDAGLQVPPDAYARNVEAGVRLIRQSGVRLVWARTTAAFEEIHNTPGKAFLRFHRDVIAYNEAADRIMRDFAVPSIDLYGFTRPFGPEAYIDHVHFSPEIRRLQAAFLAGHLLALR